MKKYKNAVVFGKFLPFHKGHDSLICYAKSIAEKVHVYVLACDGEIFSGNLRRNWIYDTYWGSSCVSVKVIDYDSTKLDRSSESNRESSKAWSDYLKLYFEQDNIDVVIGSEQYVNYVAEYSGIDGVVYDEQRKHVSVSASDIRNDIDKYWDYLMPRVKKDFAWHICICGTESTGKTTVATLLERSHDYVTMIPEIGRCLIGNANSCTMGDLNNVLNIHSQLLSSVIQNPPTPIVVWDTDNITTLSYLTYLFPDYYIDDETRCPTAGEYFFFDNTIDFEESNTRVSKEQAAELKNHHLKTYGNFGIFPAMVTSENRYDIVDEAVEEAHSDIVRKFAGDVDV